MSLFSSIEDRIDRALARLFGGRQAGVQPVMIAREAARAMEERRQVGVDAVYVPNYFEVRLHPDDLAGIQPVQNTARRDAVGYLMRTASRRGFAFAGPVEVALLADPAVERGRVSVHAAFREEATPGDPAATARYAPAAGSHAEPPGEAERTRLFVVPPERFAGTGVGWLEAVGEDGERQRLQLVPGREYTIGRAEGNDLRLADGRVSRQHARLVYVGGSWWIEDLQTTNGTRKNGAPIRRERLVDGDELVIGRVAVRYTERSSRR